MGDFYDKKRNAARDLAAWIADDTRESWSQFCRAIRKSYGLGPKSMLTTLEEDYPGFTIEDELLVKK